MRAEAINEHGVVAGFADLPGGRRPVIWSAAGDVADLGVYGRYVSPLFGWATERGTATAINDRGHVVGSTTSPEFFEVAYLWDAQSGMRLLGTLGGGSSTAWAVNSLDEVVGSAERSDGITHAFLWSRGQMLDLGALDGIYSQATAINDLGSRSSERPISIPEQPLDTDRATQRIPRPPRDGSITPLSLWAPVRRR